MFSFFSKKKKVEKTDENLREELPETEYSVFDSSKGRNYELSSADKNWNALWEKYGNGELEEYNKGIFALCDYDSGVNGGGHSGFFCNNEDNLQFYYDELGKILPADLFLNFKKAFQSYDTESEEEMCNKADDCFYENEQLILDILQYFANKMAAEISITVYNCETPGNIVPIYMTQEDARFAFSQFFIVEKYEYLYQQEKSRFGVNTPYALPGIEKAMKPYYGFDRNPAKHTPDNSEQLSFSGFSDIFNTISKKENCEIIYVKIVDSEDSKPEGMSFLGYDVCYPPDCNGFSAICDCMFLCRWHGCDENGTEFKKEFEMLNENGLFRNKEDAIHYLYHYLSQDWAEMGEFCILEIYR